MKSLAPRPTSVVTVTRLAPIWLLLLTAVFHWRGLLPGQAFLPVDNVNNNLPWRSGPFALADISNQEVGDPIYQFYPFLVQTTRAILNGEWPIWNSDFLLGQPFVGDPLSMTTYPVFLILSVAFGPARGLTLGLWLHTALAALFTYRWLRTCERSYPAAVLGALTYACSCFMVRFFETSFWVATLCWFPAVLWMIERAIRDHSVRAGTLAALFLGISALAGQVSFVIAFVGFLGVYILGRMSWSSSREPRQWRWPLGLWLMVSAVGSLLSAVLTLPLIFALSQSHRSGGIPYAPIPIQQLATAIVPDFFGSPLTAGPSQGAYWGALNYSEGTLYSGLIATTLALIALFVVRRPETRWMGLIAAGLLYVIFDGPGVAWVMSWPGLNFIAVSRLQFMLPLVIGFLAAWAVDESSPQIVPLLIGVGIVIAIVGWALLADWGHALAKPAYMLGQIAPAAGLLAAVALLWAARRLSRLNALTIKWGFVGLTFLDLFVHYGNFNPAAPLTSLPQPTPAIAYLQANHGPYRVATLQSPSEIIFGPNYLSTFDIPDLSGYHSLLPTEVVRLVTAGDTRAMTYNANTIWLGEPSQRLLDLLQAKLIVSLSPVFDLGPVSAFSSGSCSARAPEITAGHPGTGSFRVRETAINRLDLFFRTTTPRDVDLTVRMWQGERRERLVLENTFRADLVADQQAFTFFFAPETTAPGKFYEWEITTAAEDSGVYICETSASEPAFDVYGVDWIMVYAGELTITERAAPLPRAYVVYAAEHISDPDQAARRLLDEAFDIRNISITSDPVGLRTEPTQLATTAFVDSYSTSLLVIRATAEEPGLLVLGDQYQSGWQVQVDGQPAEVVAVNLVWRGVRLTPGEHTVVFSYVPLPYWIGLGISGLGVACLLGLWFWGSRPAFSKEPSKP